MPAPRINLELAVPQLEDSTRRFTEVLQSVKDPTADAIGVWSIGETAAHASHICDIFRSIAAGEGSRVEDPHKLEEAWAKDLAADPERDPTRLAGRIESSVAAFVDHLDDKDPMEGLAWHGGLPVARGCLPGIVVNELELHGRDIALAENRPWRMSRAAATLAIRSLGGVLPYFLDRGAAGDLDAIYELRLRGDGRFFAHVKDGALEMGEERPDRVDCHLSVDPVAYLMVAYGRMSRARAMASGKLVAWGRRPALALRFAKLFVPP